jgi:acetone carboxylase gamma subunit
MTRPIYPINLIKDLYIKRHKMPWDTVKKIMSSPKDLDRFKKWIRVLQEELGWEEKIVLPIHEHLFIVNKDNRLIVKGKCGYEYGDYRENWKLRCSIYVRKDEDSLNELWGELLSPDPHWTEFREYYCPGCGTLLDVENVPPGYPPIFEFLPDLEGFYKEWLDEEIEAENLSFEDKSMDLVDKWSKELESERE